MAAWIFQGNPDKFAIDDYLAMYPELIYWRTPKHAKEIAIGDDVFFWRSGSDSGIVAFGVVVEAPTSADSVLHPEALGDDLWHAETPDPKEPKTGVQLLEIRLHSDDGFISRDRVKALPEMSTASIIRVPRGTIFPLAQIEVDALKGLIGAPAVSVHADVYAKMEGDKVLRSHYRRERSSFLKEKKLDQIRNQFGTCTCFICGICEEAVYPKGLGDRIFEVHHKVPISRAAIPVRTTLDDLVVLCANCHRAVHASRTVEENFDSLVAHFEKK